MELKEPRRKRRLRGRPRPTPRSSFPVPMESLTGIPTSSAMWHINTGKYNGDFVIIEDREEMCRLNSQGYFGKGSLSRNFPEFDQITHGIPPFIRERQWELRNSWSEIKCRTALELTNFGNIETDHVARKSIARQVGNSSESFECLESEKKSELNEDIINAKSIPSIEAQKTNDVQEDNQTSLGVSQGRIVVVLNDSDSECDEGNYIIKLKSRIETEPCSIDETLHLTLEEAFFLSYALGCLKVLDLFGNNLSLINMWQLFIESQSDFIQMYVVYHYFRAKGWIVKPGLKFGGDFVLYKQGPSFYHSSYIVKIEVIEEKSPSFNKKIPNSIQGWTRLMGLNRLAETANKEVLLCQVLWPSNLSETALKTPKVLTRFSVHEVLVRRWVASQERHIDEDDEL